MKLFSSFFCSCNVTETAKMRGTLSEGHWEKSKLNANFECILHTFERVGMPGHS